MDGGARIMARVLLIALDVVGRSMAGPAIRYLEFARVLSREHAVVLITPNTPDIKPEGFSFAPYGQLREEIKKAEVVVCQQLNPKIALWLALYRPRLLSTLTILSPLSISNYLKPFL